VFCDIGSGTGRPSLYAGHYLKPKASVGFDICPLQVLFSVIALKNLRKKNMLKEQNIFFFQGDLEVMNSLNPATHCYAFFGSNFVEQHTAKLLALSDSVLFFCCVYLGAALLVLGRNSHPWAHRCWERKGLTPQPPPLFNPLPAGRARSRMEEARAAGGRPAMARTPTATTRRPSAWPLRKARGRQKSMKRRTNRRAMKPSPSAERSRRVCDSPRAPKARRRPSTRNTFGARRFGVLSTEPVEF
jgi:hypothetical protein